MRGVVIIANQIFVSYAFLKANDIPAKRIRLWNDRKLFEKEIINGEKFLPYDAIPEPSKKVLPAKDQLQAICNAAKYDELIEDHYSQMLRQKTSGFFDYRERYKETYNLSNEKSLHFAQLHAVWEYVLGFNNDGRCFETKHLYQAFSKVYPGKYNTYRSFCNAKTEAQRNGIENIALDKRLFSSPKNIKRISKLQEYWTAGIVSIGKKYSNRQAWEKIKELCKEAATEPPSLSWVDKYRKAILKKNINVFTSRNGSSKSFATQQPYASMQEALFANDQWQMDGWTLPFWVDGEKKYERFSIVIVRDAYSKKIVGSSVGKSENTLVIMDALKDAIIKTGSLPFEIVTDNHSFNQTKEAAYFKDEISKIGVQFTVTSNPQYKSIVERYNQHLDGLCKDYYGYIGQGIKSKNQDAHPKQELIDQYAKYQISEGEILLRGIKIVADFNSAVLPSKGKAPNDLFAESEKPHAFAVSLADRVKILTAQSEFKVVRGQVNLKRGFTKFEYQLPAHLQEKYNNEYVKVRYEDLNDCIYLYDLKTDEFIIELRQKLKIHAAKANQTAKDVELLYKNKGRLSGIKVKAAQANEELTREALKENPEAFAMLNKITTPKSILQEIEQDANLKREANDRGIELTKISVINEESELDNDTLKPKSDEYNTPYYPKNHQIRRISIEDIN